MKFEMAALTGRTTFSVLCLFWVSCFVYCGVSHGKIVSAVSHGKIASAVVNDDGIVTIVHDESSATAVAGGKFTNAVNQTGWGMLDVWTFSHVDDLTQAYGAGLVEGYLTKDLVKMRWANTVAGYCEKPYSTYCMRLKTFLYINLKWIYQQITDNPSSPYWHQIALQLAQINGLSDGVNNIAGKPRIEIDDIFGLYLLQMFGGDIEDLEPALKSQRVRRVIGSGSCSALIKFLPGYKDLLVSHVTWDIYPHMLRILKKYSFNYHLTQKKGSDLVPGNSMSFSGYPGTIWSGDDFYTMGSGLVSQETTITNYNGLLWYKVKPTNSVLENFRAMLANRLATDIQQWSDLFSKYNSGTYNNQWMVVDYNMFQAGQRPKSSGLLQVIEQLPGMIVSQDQTKKLLNETYWASYNLPYYSDIFVGGGNEANVHKYGDWFNHDKSPRAQIFRRDHKKVVDMKSMLRLMRYNDYKHDPLSRCNNCTPPYSADNAISARDDLNPTNGTYPFGALGHRLHGGTDAKITSSELVRSLSFVAVSGPTWDDQPPFRWSTSSYRDTVPHHGHPDLFKFEPILVQWDSEEGYLRKLN